MIFVELSFSDVPWPQMKRQAVCAGSAIGLATLVTTSRALRSSASVIVGMQAHRLAIDNVLRSPTLRHRAVQAKFARNDLLGEIAGADEIRHDVNLPPRVWRSACRKFGSSFQNATWTSAKRSRRRISSAC